MKPEQQRIEIAKACGFVKWDGSNSEQAKGYLFSDDLPDYLNDLNAMHDAFSKLGRHWHISQVGDGYVCRIEFGPRNKDVIAAGLELLSVMSEAFLRTLNLWQE